MSLVAGCWCEVGWFCYWKSLFFTMVYGVFLLGPPPYAFLLRICCKNTNSNTRIRTEISKEVPVNSSSQILRYEESQSIIWLSDSPINGLGLTDRGREGGSENMKVGIWAYIEHQVGNR